MADIQETLAEREVQHGPFLNHCGIEDSLRTLLEQHGDNLNVVQRIGLGMIFHKIARILNKGHRHSDTWHDIAGYATLVEQDILNE